MPSTQFHIEPKVSRIEKSFTVTDDTNAILWIARSRLLDSNTYIFAPDNAEQPRYTIHKKAPNFTVYQTIVDQSEKTVAIVTYRISSILSKFAWQIRDPQGSVLAAGRIRGTWPKVPLLGSIFGRPYIYDLLASGQSVCVLSEKPNPMISRLVLQWI